MLLQSKPKKELASSFGLYLHIPYCKHRCPYCDFNVHVRKAIPETQLIEALGLEAQLYSEKLEWEARKISTIFLGGGTPSLLSAASITTLLENLKRLWEFEENIEISMEANPDNLSESNLFALKQAGINRLSIGVQSLSDKFLKILGRNHTSSQAKNCVLAAQKIGFENINIDLMFSLPHQNLEELKSDVENAIKLNTQHISYYSLTIEAGTPFYERQLAGSLVTPDNDLSAGMMETVMDLLNANSYSQYEVSNYAKPGFRCRHNQGYWKAKDYLGIGPGAHSAFSKFNQDKKISTTRWSNLSMPERYLENPKNSVAWSETISDANLLFETLFLGLRHTEGISIVGLIDSLNQRQKQNFWKLIEDMRSDKFIESGSNQNLALSKKGLMIADSVIQKFSAVLT